MNNPEENSFLLIKYIDGELSESERLAFETELQNNPSLEEKLEEVKLAELALKHYGLKTDVALIHQEIMNEQKMPAFKFSRNTLLPALLKIAASIGIVVFLGLLYKFISVSAESTYHQQYLAFTISTDRGSAATSAIENAYQKQDYNQLITLFKKTGKHTSNERFIAGMAYLQLNMVKNAIDIFNDILKTEGENGNLHDDAEYYLGLAYIKNHNFAEALNLFERIHKDKSHIYNEKVSFAVLLDLKILNLKK
ncbi:hypothetical protein QWY86_06225 [Pedobacter aquatilis]|uniref:hypothetical protein n=1 Tax=Pedobacter aquatilis TaxID=351343 RepID=UPI0025B53276|nr:hypothetical protein [Pedobacter aquatilis]MDN3586255.1 hypothetical protein [Pedobacter aquatilis]